MEDRAPAVIIMEACGSAHFLGTRDDETWPLLIAPQYLRPFVKRQKNVSADAEAIVVAAQRTEIGLLNRSKKSNRPVLYCSDAENALCVSGLN